MPTDQRYFAFLRAINVAGQRLTNDQLTEPFLALGLADVAAYQAAGNITFRTSDPDKAQPAGLGAALAEAYGFETEVFVRRADELRAIVGATPFADDQLAGTEGRIQVTLLRSRPSDEAIAEALGLVPAEDLVSFVGREWFWLPRRDVSQSRLPIGAIERLVGPMTMRTAGTLDRMLARFER